MRITLALIVAATAALYSASTWAQSLADICATVELPTRAEYDSNVVGYADNFCALATYAPNRAASQLNKTVSLVRATNNPNRFYWDPKVEPDADYIQLLRPWMVEQGGWKLYHKNGHQALRVLFVSPRGSDQNVELTIESIDGGAYRHQYELQLHGFRATDGGAFTWFVLGGDNATLLLSRNSYYGYDDLASRWPAGYEATILVQRALDCLGQTVPDSLGETYLAAFTFTRGEADGRCPLP